MTSMKRLFLAMVSPPGEFNHFSPPLGLLYIAAYLRERFNLDIRLVNQRLAGWSPERLAKEIISFEPHIVGLSCMTPSAYTLPVITEALRTALPDALIVLGGPHVATFRENSLEGNNVDAAVIGEGEIAMEQILRAYLEGGGLNGIPGLIRREADGSVVINPGDTPTIKQLDSLPMPAYDLIDLSEYWNRPSSVLIPRRKYISFFSSRGCPYGCIYCHNPFGKNYRKYSAERIVDEIKYGIKNFGVDNVDFLDDCFNFDKKRVLAYSELMCSQAVRVKTAFPSALRADLLDEETVDALVNAGMYFTSLALESGSPRIQQFIKKRLDIPKFLNAASLCVKRGVFTNGFVMLGFPTETASEIEQTIRVTSESQLHTALFFRVIPLLHTDLYEYVRNNAPEKLKDLSYDTKDDSRALNINLSEVSDEEMDKYLYTASRNFYLKPRRIYRILRDYPQPQSLPYYDFIFLKRILGIYP